MELWFFLALCATFFFGVQSFLMKKAAAKDENSFLVITSFMFTPAILAIFWLLFVPQEFGNWKLALLLGVIDGICFGATQTLKIETLKHIPTNVALPILRTGSIIVILYAVLFLKEVITPLQIIGIIISFGVVFILASEKHDEKKKDKIKLGFLFLAVAVVCAGIGGIATKTASDHVNIGLFTLVAYLIAGCSSLTAYLGSKRKNTVPKKQSIITGIYCGLLSGIGWFLMAIALKLGKAAIIFPLIHMYLLVTILLTTIVYKEKFTSKRVLGLVLTVIAIFLLQ